MNFSPESGRGLHFKGYVMTVWLYHSQVPDLLWPDIDPTSVFLGSLLVPMLLMCISEEDYAWTHCGMVNRWVNQMGLPGLRDWLLTISSSLPVSFLIAHRRAREPLCDCDLWKHRWRCAPLGAASQPSSVICEYVQKSCSESTVNPA